jgi:uncharacterized membrane protein
VDTGWKALVARWAEAGVIDSETADRIRVFEEQRPQTAAGWRWPVVLALAAGALMLGAAVLLFVSAHWDTLSPAMRFSVVVAMVTVFHLGGAAMADRSPAMASSLHAVGTVALGAAIFLSGQIFNLDEHWPSGVMLWAAGAVLGWALLRNASQLALTATLLPAWLLSEWTERTRWSAFAGSGRVAACGSFLLALAYFTAPGRGAISRERRVLLWLGGLALLPAAGFLSTDFGRIAGFAQPGPPPLSTSTHVIGWILALGLPMTVAVATRRRLAWMTAVAILWAVGVTYARTVTGDVSVYGLWAIGAAGLVFWGLHDKRTERINMGTVLFAVTVLAFYFSHVMDKLERSMSLAGLGVLFLAGGWALERTRRRLAQQARGART